MQKKSIILVIVLVIVGGGAYFTYPYYSRYFEKRETVSPDSDRISRILEFNIKDQSLDNETADRYFRVFNQKKKFFLDHFGQAEVFYAVLDIGIYKQAVQDYQGAEEAWLYAREAEPNSYVVNGNLAYLYHHYLNDYQKAEEYYLLALAPTDVINSYNYYNGLYELYHYKLADQAKAEEILNKALEKLPDSIDVLFLAGGYHRDTGDIVKAKEFYSKVLKIDLSNDLDKNELAKLNN